MRACAGIDEVGQRQWDACANPQAPQGAASDEPGACPFDPFVSFAFLNALEQSGSVAPETGWAPYHLILSAREATAPEIHGVVPMYLKHHSQGEYVFDHNWADAFEHAGGQYYPKFQIAVPFTPATGRRILSKPPGNVGSSTDTARDQIGLPAQQDTEGLLIAGMQQVAEALGVSSVHVTFADQAQWQALGQRGFLQRTHTQFHWQNHGYATFEDFLSALSSKKRKNIRRERRDALASGITIERLTGSDLGEHHWDAFYQFYTDTGSRKWGSPYLNRQFFSLIGTSMPDDILLVLCKRDGRYIAGAINFIGGDCLFGRNWGCVEDHPFLHFEACYYQAMEFAIERQLDRVEAGAQGAHKLARGYMPSRTYSAHWIANPAFRDAVSNYLESERRQVEQESDYINDHHSPFRSAG